MEETRVTVEKEEHRAITFLLNRKEAAQVARYLKQYSGSREICFAVDVDSRELIIQSRDAGTEDWLSFEGEEDIFDVENEIEETAEVIEKEESGEE